MTSQPTDRLAFASAGAVPPQFRDRRESIATEQERCALDWVASNPDAEWPPSLCALIKAGAARIAFRRAQDLAAQYGAHVFRGPAASPAFQCWADRIAWLPTAAERGPEALAAAVAEANRYAGR